MAGTHDGAKKSAARRLGLSLPAYEALLQKGQKWCSRCREWHARSAFLVDASRYDGLAASCRSARKTHYRASYVRKGRKPRLCSEHVAGRDNDKKQARRRVNAEVEAGLRPHPNTIPCTDCGHVWRPGERRHEYDHYLGYDARYHRKVQAVCTRCHRRRDAKGRCTRGHSLLDATVTVDKKGHRICKVCTRIRDRARRKKSLPCLP